MIESGGRPEYVPRAVEGLEDGVEDVEEGGIEDEGNVDTAAEEVVPEVAGYGGYGDEDNLDMAAEEVEPTITAESR